MKRLAPVSILVVLIISLSACNLPTPQAFTPTASGQDQTPLPSATIVSSPSAAPADTATPEPSATPAPTAETQSPGVFSLEMLKNFSYLLSEFDAQVTLQDGIYDVEPLYTRLIEPVAFGDLNGDGRQDAALVLATNSGGSGTFYDLITLLDQGGAIVQAGSAYFGDRQGVKSLQIVDGRVVLDYITQSLSDPLCCPSEHRLRSYLLDGGVLCLASEQVLVHPDEQATALPNAIFIDQPAYADKLTSPQQVSGRVSQVPPSRNLQYYVTDHSATLLMQGEFPLQGDLGGPGSFTFQFDIGPQPYGLITLEVVDSASGILRGRTVIELLGQ